MEDHPDWPMLLTDYQSALDEFERVTRALTAALVDPNSAADDFSELFAAESRARHTVVLSRMRLVNAWRDSLQQPTADGNDKDALGRDDSNDR